MRQPTRNPCPRLLSNLNQHILLGVFLHSTFVTILQICPPFRKLWIEVPFVLVVYVQIDCQQHDQTGPNILHCKWLWKEIEGENDGDRFAHRSHLKYTIDKILEKTYIVSVRNRTILHQKFWAFFKSFDFLYCFYCASFFFVRILPSLQSMHPINEPKWEQHSPRNTQRFQ